MTASRTMQMVAFARHGVVCSLRGVRLEFGCRSRLTPGSILRSALRR